MKPVKTVINLLLLSYAGSALAQTADDFIAQGRSFLAATNLISANNSFSNAVSLSPNNQTGNVFYAATRVLALPYQPTGSNFLNRLGIPITGRSVYDWTAQLPTDTNGVPLAPAGVDANEVTAVLRTNVIPTLIAAETNLATVTDTNFLLNLSSQDTGITDVQLDYGDVLLLRALLQATIYFGYTVNSWNVDAQFTALRSLYLSDGLNPGQLLSQYPELFTFSTTNDMAVAKTAFSNAVSLYVQASSFIRARPINETRLFNYDLALSGKESNFRKVISGLQSALDGAVRLQVGNDLTVNLPPLFDGLHPWRPLLPEFSGKSFVLGGLDPSFQGVITGLDLGTAEKFIAKHFPAVPDFAPSVRFGQGQFLVQLNVLPDRGYAIESSADLLNWNLIFHEFATNTVIDFADPAVGSRVFYRAHEESNSRFAAPYVINGLPAVAAGSNQGATSEPDDPTNYFNQIFGVGSPVWWTWTAPASGEVGISAAGTVFSQVLGVFTGASLPGLVPVVNLAVNSSEFDFQATAGTTYFIAVESGYFLQEGDINLALAGPPPNDNFTNRQSLNGTTISVDGSSILSSEEQNEPSRGGHSVWYTWTAPQTGSVTLSANGPGYPTATIFTGSDLTNLNQVSTIYSGGNSITFDAVGGTSYQIQIDGYETGNFTLALELFAGSYPLFLSVYPSEGGTVGLQPSPDANGMYTPGTAVTLSAQAAPGFMLNGWRGAVTTNNSVSQVSLVMNGSQSIQVAFSPVNDDFASATVLTGTNAATSGSTDGASNEPGEPGFFYYPTVWYSWTAPASGSVMFWLDGAGQAEMNVYTGNQVTNLSAVSVFSRASSHGISSLSFDAVSGTSYHVQVSGFASTFKMALGLSVGYYQLVLSSSPVGAGVIVATPAVTNGLYFSGLTVSLQAEPAAGWQFIGWAGDANGVSPVIQLILDKSVHVRAVFDNGNFNVIHTFQGNDGAFPYSRLVVSGSSLYGTTLSGGAVNSGTVFAINIDGSGFNVLHSFAGVDGSGPIGPIVGVVSSGNMLYGTTSAGGPSGYGTVFAVNIDGTDFETLHNFTGADGSEPDGVLVLSSNILYGVTDDYPSQGQGTLFSVNIDGTGFTTLHEFGGDGGIQPSGALIISANTLYGATTQQGAAGEGTIFKVATDGSGFTILHGFSFGDTNGTVPTGDMLLSQGTLYGTTEYGGGSGSGVIFSMNVDGTDFKAVYNFTTVSGTKSTNTDGIYPKGGLALSGSTLYGTAYFGGSSGEGTVFAINIDGTGFKTLHSFSAASGSFYVYNSDGVNPDSGLLLWGSRLYGTATGGGTDGVGTIFRVPLLTTASIQPQPITRPHRRRSITNNTRQSLP